MNTTLRPNPINIDLQNDKQPWLDYCKSRGVTPCAAFRQIVVRLTSGTISSEPPVVQDTTSKKYGSSCGAPKGEVVTAHEIARCEGFSLTRWIVALINAGLYATPQLGQRELETLARSNLQLLAISRNLNQLARAINACVSITPWGGRDVIEALRAAVLRHAERVATVIHTNAARLRSN